MSDVRLSNGSPTLERTDSSRLADHPKPSACRSLFGSVDHEELKRDLKGHLREMEDAASAKWGFDFAAHSPLPNGHRLHWEPVDCRDVPGFYSRQPGRRREKKGVCSAGNNKVDLNGNHSCVVEDTDRADGLQMECTEQCTGLRKRPASHDPSAQNKRSHTSSDEVTCPNLSLSTEHTPRKTSPKRQT
ncbi:cyclin-dependent kinase inhibitor 1Bb [Sebastes umbrosus]|uniref:cyclin-dependent kinase inhibitor 1Bb n=1 Tax=Sebastes umbrosus TaxID=72105 RepID=UPI00189D820E|nr:cyclin-dependent kinase inhibitor 1Bb [Sebastes umbrosus]